MISGCFLGKMENQNKKAIPMFYHDALSYRHRQNSEKNQSDSEEESNSRASDNLFGCSTAELTGDSLE